MQWIKRPVANTTLGYCFFGFGGDGCLLVCAGNCQVVCTIDCRAKSPGTEDGK